ncbi:MAG: carbohydrate ABC transporter permease [Ilumatobacter sp.]|jgi:ABC-type glycerol-3-phosphate transport system permease component|uniref:carbohydrate ABC transporter permease n=1 Tax=Ilumatobacter sp. TaxID=1967498 RepID=UPI001D5E8B66|nr:carbohydrate ABC transporter permease [Ilumatobacter sp.]MBT5552962.1 carbohydrate ABC transporter permease [Ilumatobacter sp.]MBT5866306.1 carbohydrate ABC transporter permease [Ilumatobacter sp.]MDG1392335.1 carbohydrate ABC transporter permease [Ilumatobacter sp.]
MSVRRKGPRATIVRIFTYLCLVSVAVIVVFPFVVAFATSTKNSQDIFNYPPTLIPKEPQTVDPAEVAFPDIDADEPLPLYAFPDSDTRFALVDNDVSVAEFRPLDDVDRIIRLDVTSGEKTGEVVIIDGAEEDVFVIEVDGINIEAYRSRLTSGGQFVSLDDPTDVRVELVNVVEPLQQFGPRLENFEEVLIDKELGRSLTNTVLVTIAVVSGQILTSILGGYAFARIKFKGSGSLFLLYLGSVMVPFVVLIIPLFQLMLQVGWLDNLSALIIPFMFSAYGTFLMRQFFISIPIEIEEAALLDNASRWKILWRIMVPLARPAIATLATFGFLYAWNSFFWPLVIINSGNPDGRVLSLALSTLGGRSSTDLNLVFAGAMIAMTPPILVFLFAQRYFVENSASSGLK